MKSKFFRDAHELDSDFGRCAPNKVCVCLRIGRRAYDIALVRSQCLGISSGEYVEALLLREDGDADRDTE